MDREGSTKPEKYYYIDLDWFQDPHKDCLDSSSLRYTVAVSDEGLAPVFPPKRSIDKDIQESPSYTPRWPKATSPLPSPEYLV